MKELKRRPDAVDLITLVQSYLSELAAREEGEARYQALMARAALQIAGRELTQAEKSDPRLEAALQKCGLIDGEKMDPALSGQALKRLAKALREGKHDGDPTLFDGLVRLSELSLEVSNPKALTASQDR